MRRIASFLLPFAAACGGPQNTPIKGVIANTPVDTSVPAQTRSLSTKADLDDGRLETKIELYQVDAGVTVSTEVKIFVASPATYPQGAGVDVNTNGVTASMKFVRTGGAGNILLQESAQGGRVQFNRIGATAGSSVEGWYRLVFNSGQIEGQFAAIATR